MNLPSIIILSIILLLVILALRQVRKNHQRGGCAGCHCNCSLRQKEGKQPFSASDHEHSQRDSSRCNLS